MLEQIKAEMTSMQGFWNKCEVKSLLEREGSSKKRKQP